jgi:hypothetical protein
MEIVGHLIAVKVLVREVPDEVTAAHLALLGSRPRTNVRPRCRQKRVEHREATMMDVKPALFSGFDLRRSEAERSATREFVESGSALSACTWR